MKYNSRISRGALAAVTALVVGSTVQAAPLVNLWMVGRVVNSGSPFTGQVAVQAGDRVEYQVWLQMAPLGTVHALPTGQLCTVSYLAHTTVAGTGDGVNSFGLNITQDPTDPIQADLDQVTLNPDPSPTIANDGWNLIAGASGARSGRAGSTGGTYHDLINIRPGHSAGIFTGIEPEIVLTGSYTVPLAGEGAPSQLKMSLAVALSGGVIVNRNHPCLGLTHGGIPFSYDPFLVTSATESFSDPIFGFINLPASSAYAQQSVFGQDFSLAAASTPVGLKMVLAPEPSTLGLLAVPALALMKRRRR